MAPVNGMLLLRWLREAPESPNRFMPSVMLSGAADSNYVTAGRDLGMTEFLAKPFSAHSIYKRLPNHLKQKVGGKESSEPDEMPTALLEQAEEKLQRSALDFTEWAQTYLKNLVGLCDVAMKKPGSRRKHFEEINLLAHELRGQGGTFGYPLNTVLGKMLYDTTHKGCREDNKGVEIVRAHVDSMRAVIRDKVAGDGGAVGRALLKSLQLAIQKHEAIE